MGDIRVTTSGDDLVPVDLAIGGMTCASCAARIERRLSRLDGVTASVNYATERATVRTPADIAVDQLIAEVEAAGDTARDARAAITTTVSAAPAPDRDDETRRLRDRLLMSTILSAPVVVLAMIPALQFEYWQWLSLTLAAPVATWGAWPFHRAAWANVRHATATMDTLISLGVLAAFGWSLYALFFGDAGVPGMTHGFTFRAERGMGASSLYLEVAAGVTTLILGGRFFEARAKRRSGAALRALLEAIVDAYDFDRFDRIVDVGGGDGTLLIAILSVYLHPTGLVFDLPHVVPEATARIARAGIGHRCEAVGGSYLDGVAGGGDLYVFKSVLMDCPDDQAAVALRNVRTAMNDDGTVLVIEAVFGAPNEGEPAAFSDLSMLVATGGRIRGRDEWRSLLVAAGFELVDIRPTASRLSLIEARPAAP